MLKIDCDVITSCDNDVICCISILINSVSTQMKLHLDKTKYLQRSLYYFTVHGEYYEPDYTSLMMTVLRPGDTIIDVGANIGYFSLLASSLVTESGKVFALEPENENFTFLTRNIELNRFSNIRALNIAAGDTKKEAVLFIDPLNDGGHSLGGISPESILQLGTADAATSRVRMETLDALLEVEKITHLKIIKIDTEGWEFHVLQGALSIIKRLSPPFILAEVNRSGLRRAGASERYLRRLMKELGYSTFVATCLANNKLVLELLPDTWYAEPGLEHYNYNAVFARPEALNDYSSCYHIFD